MESFVKDDEWVVLFLLFTRVCLLTTCFSSFFCFSYLDKSLSNVFELSEEILQSHRSLLTFLVS